MSTRFAGKVAIITGAGSGIGKATIVRFIEEGGTAVGIDLVQPRLLELQSELNARGLSVKIVAGDLLDSNTIARALEAAGEKIDILINNAGIMDDFVPLDELDDALWDRVLGVNVTAVMRLSREVIKKMLVTGKGSIVTTASAATFKSGIAGTAYVTSKHAVAGFVKSVATIYGPRGIRSNAVAPGAVATNIMDISKPPRGQETMQALGVNMANMGKAATSGQLASAILY
ncbi:MAG: SDR family NAD(P)-dependent oxidoreductase, partial [Actinobacteria bacterium]|nr:SDR family NAD(P)-dependent oxidoreductase [Actinomycetota bacterium]